MAIGSKLQVWNGTASKTSGGLTRNDLMISPRTGKIVSKRQHMAGKKNASNLGKHLHAKKATRKSPRRANKEIGEGIFSSLLGTIGLGLPKRKQAGKGGAYASSGGKVKRKHTRKQQGKGAYASDGGKLKRRMRGGAWYNDVLDGIKQGVDVGSKILPFVL